METGHTQHTTTERNGTELSEKRNGTECSEIRNGTEWSDKRNGTELSEKRNGTEWSEIRNGTQSRFNHLTNNTTEVLSKRDCLVLINTSLIRNVMKHFHTASRSR